MKDQTNQMKRLIDVTASILKDEKAHIQQIPKHKRKVVFIIMLDANINLLLTIKEVEVITTEHCDRVIGSLRGLNRVFTAFGFTLNMTDAQQAWFRAKEAFKSTQLQKPTPTLKDLFR